MKYVFILVSLFFSLCCNAQSIIIQDLKTNKPIPFATISSKGLLLAVTDSFGRAKLVTTAPNEILSIDMVGYKRLDTTVLPTPGGTTIIYLAPDAEALDEVTIVSSTRTNQAIETSPMKVEVLGQEELNEESTIKPGNIASLLGDVSGVQIQQTSATSGNSTVRIQGLDGKYTQIVRDGMPLYDGFSGGFGILTIPPLDLKQIELIKGAASTLYGGGAIAGLINLISKRPTFDQTLDVLVNYSTLNEFNANVYLSKRNNKLGYTLFGGYNHQKAGDENGDGLSDVPNAQSLLIHPTLFYYPSFKTTISAGYSGTFDDRKGGNIDLLEKKASAANGYFEQDKSVRHTFDYLLEHSFPSNSKFTFKGNVSNFDRTVTTNTDSFEGNQTSFFSEASLFVPFGGNSLVAGVNTTGGDFTTNGITSVLHPNQTYNNYTLGAFAQYSWQIKENSYIETGVRLDKHSTYDFFPLPRIAAFYRFSPNWAARGGFGMGYRVPSPLEQLTYDTTHSYFLPMAPNIKPELSYGYNAEVNYKKTWDNNCTFFINEALFMTDVEHPIFYDNASGVFALNNKSTPTTSFGSDTYLKLSFKNWEYYMGYTFTNAQNNYYSNSNGFVPLTPKNRLAFVLVKEIEKTWRFGLEGSWFGQQYRYDGSTTPSYFFMALMVQRNLGKHTTLVLNCENLLDYRMTNVEPIYTGTIDNPVFKPLWAPVDGRVVNLSIRWRLAGK